MRYVRTGRILAIALVLALLTAIMPVTTVQAQNLFAYPTNGEIGDYVDIFGHGFTGGTSVDIYFSSDKAEEDDYIDDEVTAYKLVATASVGDEVGVDLGEFDTTIVVPERLEDGDDYERVRGGTYYIYVTTADYKRIKDVVQFTVESVALITIDPDDGVVGTEVDVSGEGYGDREDIIVEYDGDTVEIESGADESDRDGEFEFTILIPESYAGAHTITVTGDDTELEAEAEFTVKPKITISPESGAAGDTITVTGTGFGNRADFSITLNDTEVVADERTDRDGGFEVTFAAPAEGPGSYDIEVKDADDNSATAEFTITEATFSISPTTGYVGIAVTVSGTGFQANKPIPITFDNISVGTATTDEYGKFTASFNVPTDGTAGPHKVKVTDGTNAAQADFEIVTSASISPTTSTASPGNVGTGVTVSGIGFLVNTTVTITYDGTQIATAPVSTDGTFSTTFSAPASSGGSHTIVASDGTNTRQFTFIMESAPPAIPGPLIPEMGVKAEAEAYFDWEDVTDPSGVTYTLQIATTEDFAEDSMVLEKTELVQSEYTLTEEERLKSVSKEEPYYWHVKAIDGASNKSKWTGTGEFYVGFTFELSQQVIYLLIGVGALLLGIFGFWLGRKTAYY